MSTNAFRQIAPGRIQVVEGGGCLAVFGLPFLAAGVFFILAALGVVPLETGRLPRMQPAFVLVGLPFVLVGGTLVLGRSWTTVSAIDRTIVKQLGLLVPMSTKTYRVDDYNGITLQFIRGDSDSSDQYPVSVKARAGRDLRLFSSTEYAEARARAIAVASLLQFEIEDSTGGGRVRMSPAQAEMSFQNRQRIEHAHDELVVPPASMRSRVSESNGTVTIVIPGRRMALTGLLKRRHTILTASTAGLRIEQRALFRTRARATYAAADILDVQYTTPDTTAEIERRRPAMAAPPAGKATELLLQVVRAMVGSGGITIKTRKGLTTIGENLDDRELRYLHYVIRNALSPQLSARPS